MGGVAGLSIPEKEAAIIQGLLARIVHFGVWRFKVDWERVWRFKVDWGLHRAQTADPCEPKSRRWTRCPERECVLRDTCTLQRGK